MSDVCRQAALAIVGLLLHTCVTHASTVCHGLQRLHEENGCAHLGATSVQCAGISHGLAKCNQLVDARKDMITPDSASSHTYLGSHVPRHPWTHVDRECRTAKRVIKEMLERHQQDAQVENGLAEDVARVLNLKLERGHAAKIKPSTAMPLLQRLLAPRGPESKQMDKTLIPQKLLGDSAGDETHKAIQVTNPSQRSVFSAGFHAGQQSNLALSNSSKTAMPQFCGVEGMPAKDKRDCLPGRSSFTMVYPKAQWNAKMLKFEYAVGPKSTRQMEPEPIVCASKTCLKDPVDYKPGFSLPRKGVTLHCNDLSAFGTFALMRCCNTARECKKDCYDGEMRSLFQDPSLYHLSRPFINFIHQFVQYVSLDSLDLH